MRLREGDRAPEIQGQTVSGEEIRPEAVRGTPVLLKFYRFASCPICNLHIREYVRREAELAAAGITVIAVWHSSDRKLARSFRRLVLPFTVLADPRKKLFRAYRVEESWRGMVALPMWRAYIRAMLAGFLTRPLFHEGGIKGNPADFLIDARGVIRHAHYGLHYADSLPVDRVLELATELGLTQPAREAI
jgi:peroxiredoxin